MSNLSSSYSSGLRGFPLVLAVVFAAWSVAAQDIVSATITGEVTDEAGKPVAGAKVFLNRSSGARINMEQSVWKTVTDPKGHFKLGLVFSKDKTLTVREIFSEAKGYSRAEWTAPTALQGGDAKQINFTLHPGEVLSGAINIPITEMERLSRIKPETRVHIFEVIGANLEHLSLNARCYQTEPRGAFEIYLPGGEYTLRILPASDNSPAWPGIKTGQTNLLLQPPAFEWNQETVGKAFDDFWQAMDRYYSYFFLKEDVDWQTLRKQYRPSAVLSANYLQLAEVLEKMLAPLKDMHVRIETPDGKVSLPYRIPWNYNGNLQVTLGQLEEITQVGRFAVAGKTKGDGFGCFVVLNQTEANAELVQTAAEAIRKLRHAPAFIVDLRRANGGSEPLAAEIAKLFCANETVYAKSKYRNGPGHHEFTPESERRLPASEEPYTKPVICLIGQGAISSGEGFVKMMKALPHVTTAGLRTRGSSGNPRPWPLTGTGIIVYFSRWVDLMPDGRTFEGKGIPPDVEINEPQSAYAETDPTFFKALELLREKIRAD